MKRAWLDLGELRAFHRRRSAFDRWQDHGMGLLLTILRDNHLEADVLSLRSIRSWRQLARGLRGYDQLLMNVRSYTYPFARKAAEIFKQVNPNGFVITGGMHATVAPGEMESVAAFDRICKGSGENILTDVVKDPYSFPRVFQGLASKSMSAWPMIDRTLWPNPQLRSFPWPLEPECGWGPAPVATVLTSRVCPWQCAFCNEAAFIPNMGRKPVDQVIDELNYLDRQFGPIGSVVIHDSMFFQQPPWLEEWLEKYPRKARAPWPYWAAARSDTVRRWPKLFESLIKETNWSVVSIGFESGSDRVLSILNKECTAADHEFAVDLLNRIGKEQALAGQQPVRVWANIMLGIPGETREDALATRRLLRSINYALPSISFYSPYPGSALGYQLIAENKSRMSSDNYHRYPGDEKLIGVDYNFYRQWLKGNFDRELESNVLTDSQSTRAHHLYLFQMNNGKKKIAYGESPGDALAKLKLRLNDAEMQSVIPDQFQRIAQLELLQHVQELG